MFQRHLLIIAHGSRREASNDEVRRLADRVTVLGGPDFVAVSVGFLELARPAIPEALADCVARGAREIVVVPYFLAAGTHVVDDLPQAITTFQGEHPGVTVRVTPHLGAAETLPALILALAG